MPGVSTRPRTPLTMARTRGGRTTAEHASHHTMLAERDSVIAKLTQQIEKATAQLAKATAATAATAQVLPVTPR